MKNTGRYNPKEFEEKIYKNWEEKKYFKSVIDHSKTPYTIIMPPPNVTSRLHMGHAFQQTIQDIIIRRKRMQGFNALWLPGSDHAAIATEAKVVEKLKKQGIKKEELGREKFQKHIDDWYKEYKNAIIDQFKTMGFSCDWDRLAFTMDEQNSRAVNEAFIRLYKKGLIYRGNRIVNWCPTCNTSISDAEVEYEENHTHLWHIKYQIENSKEFIVVATTRPETMLGDTAVAVSPKDKRYKHLVGKKCILPILNKPIPIIADEYVDSAFGTGAVKITPAHDINDFEVGKRHNLEVVKIMDDRGKLNELAGKYQGMDRLEARGKIVQELEEIGSLLKTEKYDNNVGHCERCHDPIETMTSEQWFVSMTELAKPAIKVVEEGKVRFVEERYKRSYLHWMKNLNDWCISRQLWSGHRIPIYYCDNCNEMLVQSTKPEVCPKCKNKTFSQDQDTLDTWFSSALWPFSTLGWPDKSADLDYYYPTDVLVTDRGIINLWVARMIFCGIEFAGDIPFREVLINGTVNDELGRKMSKSLGNGIDPSVMIDKYGVDTLRYSIINGIAVDADSRFSEAKVELSAAFLNKIWNTAKFVSMHTDEIEIEDITKVNLSEIDMWILSELNSTIKTVNTNFDKFDLGIALSNTTSFILNDFCDWYIEMVKPRLTTSKEEKTTVASVLSFVMDNILRLMHPFTPMITEFLYGKLNIKNKGETIMYANFPKYDKNFAFKKQSESATKLINLIKQTRHLRKELGIEDNKKIDAVLVTKNQEIVEKNLEAIKRLLKINQLTISVDKPSKGYSVISDEYELFIVADDFDREKELEKLNSELKNVEFEISRSERMLSNPGFVNKAPKKLLDTEKQKLSQNKELQKSFLEKIKKL